MWAKLPNISKSTVKALCFFSVCDDVPTVANADSSPQSGFIDGDPVVGAVVQYKCHTGSTLLSVNIIKTCDEYGDWIGDVICMKGGFIFEMTWLTILRSFN